MVGGVVGWVTLGRQICLRVVLAFATRRVDLMAAAMRAPLALCVDGMTILPPTKRGKNFTR